MTEAAPWSKLVRIRDGRFKRKDSEFRAAISKDGEFPAEADRYHLTISHACPWAHRTMLARKLLRLEDAISIDVVDWHMRDNGSWAFDEGVPGATASAFGFADVQEQYLAADPGFGGIGTVPILWDTKARTIVNNESREIVRMFSTVLAPALHEATDGAHGRTREDGLLPPGLEADVDAMIDANYEPVNNGVYKCGFARSQGAYDEAADAMWMRLDALEDHLDGRDWLIGDATEERPAIAGVGDGGVGVLTEADLCLWPTLVRFDPVYHTHFKCNRNLIREMPNLWGFVRRMWRLPGVRETVHFDHIVSHYYWSHASINPYRIVPVDNDFARLLDA